MSASPVRHRRLVLTLAVALVATVLPALAAGPAGADPAAPTAPAAPSAPTAKLPAPVVSPSTIPAGTMATVSGTRCRAGDSTRVYVSLMDSAGAVSSTVSATPGSDGTWSAELTPPAGATTGGYRVAATCDRYSSQLLYAPAPVTVTASTAAPWTAQTPDLPDVPNGDLVDVDCTSVTLCVAVGAVQTDGLPRPLIESWNGSTWTAQILAAPAGAESAYLDGVSCPTSGRCVAVGGAETDRGPRPLVAALGDGMWSTSMLTPPRGLQQASLADVSCARAAMCVAVGDTNSVLQNTMTPVAYRLAAGSWRATAVTATSQRWAAVSCPSVQECVAVGNTFGTGLSVPVAHEFDGTTWTAMTQPTPPAGVHYTAMDVDCPAAGTCALVGGQYNSSSTPLVETRSNRTWNLESVPSPRGESGGLGSVSCVAALRCTAVGIVDSAGASGPTRAVVVSRTSSSWATAAVAVTASDTSFDAVSCVSPTRCTAVGNLDSLPSAAVGSGADWTGQHVDAPHGFVGGRFRAVACSADEACTAVGSMQSGDRREVPLVNRWDGRSWSRQTLPDVGSGQLTGVACPTSTVCFAVGQLTLTNFLLVPLLLQWRNGTWTRVTLNAPSNSGTVLNRVSCSSATACIAVGQQPFIQSGGAYAVSFAGSTWTNTAAPPVSDLQYVGMVGLSCVTTGGCHVVVSGYTPGVGDQTRDLVWSGAAWVSGAPMPSAGAISCPTLTACVAIPRYYPDSGTPRAAVLTGSVWTTEPLAYPGLGGQTLFGDIACQSGLDCTVVGSAVDGSYIARRTGGTWVQQPMPAQQDREVSGVACTSAATCVAVGGVNRPTILVSPSA